MCLCGAVCVRACARARVFVCVRVRVCARANKSQLYGPYQELGEEGEGDASVEVVDEGAHARLGAVGAAQAVDVLHLQHHHHEVLPDHTTQTPDLGSRISSTTTTKFCPSLEGDALHWRIAGTAATRLCPARTAGPRPWIRDAS